MKPTQDQVNAFRIGFNRGVSDSTTMELRFNYWLRSFRFTDAMHLSLESRSAIQTELGAFSFGDMHYVTAGLVWGFFYRFKDSPNLSDEILLCENPADILDVMLDQRYEDAFAAAGLSIE